MAVDKGGEETEGSEIAGRSRRRREEPRMPEVQLELRGVAAHLTGLFFHLAALASSMPLAPEETSEDDFEDEPAAAAQIRSGILIGMHDHLRPLVRSLLIAAGCGVEEAERATPELSEEIFAAWVRGDEGSAGA